MTICAACLPIGSCSNLRVPIVNDAELSNPHIVAGMRYQAHAMKVSHHSWVDKALDLYARFDGVIVDTNDEEVWLDTSLLYDSKGIVWWFRDFACTPVRAGQKLFVRQTAWERTRVFATILRAHSPQIAAHWPAIGKGALSSSCP
jgi:hypothetical protein